MDADWYAILSSHLQRNQRTRVGSAVLSLQRVAPGGGTKKLGDSQNAKALLDNESGKEQTMNFIIPFVNQNPNGIVGRTP